MKSLVKWTKTDVKRMCAAIQSCHTVNRPLDHRGLGEFGALFRAHLEDPERRRAVVLGGLRELRAIAAQRATEHQAAATHFAAHPEIYGHLTPEMVARFRGYAREEERAVARQDKLIARVEATELPPEVLAYDPTVR